MNIFVEHKTRSLNAQLKYVKLDKYSLGLVVFSAGLCETYKEGICQVWYLIFMEDKDNKADIIDCDIRKSRRVVTWIPEPEMFGLMHIWDSAIVVQKDCRESLEKIARALY